MTAHWVHWIAAWLIVVFVLVCGVLVQTYWEERMTAEDRMTKALRTALIVVAVILIAIAGMVFKAFARDDGRYAASPLKPWFDSLKSGKGPCCSDADGSALADVDWKSKDGHYLVRIDGEWRDVPDDAVITEPNRDGRTMVWPLRGYGDLTIRCFMPGSMT